MPLMQTPNSSTSPPATAKSSSSIRIPQTSTRWLRNSPPSKVRKQPATIQKQNASMSPAPKTAPCKSSSTNSTNPNFRPQTRTPHGGHRKVASFFSPSQSPPVCLPGKSNSETISPPPRTMALSRHLYSGYYPDNSEPTNGN